MQNLLIPAHLLVAGTSGPVNSSRSLGARSCSSMELHAWFWRLLLLQCLCFTPVTCPSVKCSVNTPEYGTTQASNSKTQLNVNNEAIRSTHEAKTIQARTIQTGMKIQPIRTFNVTGIKPARIRQAVKTNQTVHPAFATLITGGRFYALLLLVKS